MFEHLNGLADRGHDVQLWTLGGEPDWFELHCPVRSFPDYDALVADLSPLQAIKVATWWETATPVWRASVVSGLPVYFVQDIETSYYPHHPERRHEGPQHIPTRISLPDHLGLESVAIGGSGT